MNNTERLQQLRDAGYTVRIHHTRAFRETWEPYDSEFVHVEKSKGGETSVVIMRDGRVKATGLALCSPQENFNKRLGTTIALGRAVKTLEHKGLL